MNGRQAKCLRKQCRVFIEDLHDQGFETRARIARELIEKDFTEQTSPNQIATAMHLLEPSKLKFIVRFVIAWNLITKKKGKTDG